MNRKVKCNEYRCNWNGIESDVLMGINPFDFSSVWGCPKCKEINTVVFACDELGCWGDVSSGTPTESGYRHTCRLHKPKSEVD